jgi:peptidoglycan/xylan/chitin deacetylase (PgdA/CDA1 family)
MHRGSTLITVAAGAVALSVAACSSNGDSAATAPPNPSTSTGNIVPNPGLETGEGGAPSSWQGAHWGKNTSTYSYSTGHSGSRSVNVTVSHWTSGAADWYFAPQNVVAGTTYQFSDWYKSNVGTEVDAEVTMADGSIKYKWLAELPAASTWTQGKGQITIPAGAMKISVYHMIGSNGSLTTDDYSFAPIGSFTRGLVSVTLDDGYASQYDTAWPILKNDAIPATFYIISGALTDQPAYMTGAQVQDLSAGGEEIGAHTRTHRDLTTLTRAQIKNGKLTEELAQPQRKLQNLIGEPVLDFAYPYGRYNATTVAKAAKYYQTQRTSDGGYNTKADYVPTNLRVQNIVASTTPSDVKGWLVQAAQDKSWLILVYHEVAISPVYPRDGRYTTSPSVFKAEMAMGMNSGLDPVTVASAVAEIKPQLP